MQYSTPSKTQHEFLNEAETGLAAVKCPTLKGNYPKHTAPIFMQMDTVRETPTLPRSPTHLLLSRVQRQELKSS